MSKTPEEIDRLELLAASYACDYRDSPNKTNGIPDSYLVYSIAYDAFLAGYKAAENHFRDVTEKVGPQWISVKDRLPEYDQWCSWWDFSCATEPCIAFRSVDDIETWWENYTHWMPLPAAPKEEG